jgi:pimeloyl-ACP methyl ester carboxylesterase
MQERLRTQFVDRGSAELVIAFHSRHPAGWTSFFGERQERFDFFKSLARLDKSGLFFMDVEQNWYQDSFDEIMQTIQELLARQRFHRIVTLGASYGGYAAIVVASLLSPEISKCLAFAPQTDLSQSTTRMLLDRFGDPAGFRPFDNQSNVRDSRYFDCQPLVAAAPGTEFTIVYSEGSDWDRYFAERLTAGDHLLLRGFDFADHNVGLYLSRQNRLLDLIRGAIA